MLLRVSVECSKSLLIVLMNLINTNINASKFKSITVYEGNVGNAVFKANY